MWLRIAWAHTLDVYLQNMPKLTDLFLGYGECASIEYESSESTNNKGLHR